MSTYRWIKHEGYHEIHQYVDENDRICGEVGGSRFQPSDGWIANDARSHPFSMLGCYVSLNAAKAAIERHFATIETQ